MMSTFDLTTIRSTAAWLLLGSSAWAQGTPPAPAPATTPAAAPTTSPASPAVPTAAAPVSEPAPSPSAAVPPPAAPAAAPVDDVAGTPATAVAGDAAPNDPAALDAAQPASATAETDGRRVLAAPPPPPPPPPPPEPVVLGDAAGRLEVGLGLHLNWITDEEFDLFSAADVLPQVSLRAGVTVWQSGRWSALAMVGGEYGGLGTAARGTQTHLELGRMLLGGELRGHVFSGLVGYGRLLAGPAILASRVGQPGDPDTFALVEPAVAVSAALGTAVRLYGSKNGPARSFRLEAYLQGGYDFVSDIGLVYVAGPDGPLRPEPLDLGVLSASGAMLGFGFQGSY